MIIYTEGRGHTFMMNHFRHVTLAHCVSWIMSTTSTSGALLITVMYWALLFSPDYPVAYLDVFVHGLNSVIVVVDIFISARDGHQSHEY